MAPKRWVISVVLVALTAALVFVTVPALYLRTQVLVTDRYVETVAPLAADPAIQADVARHVTEQMTAAIDVERRARDALTELTRSSPIAEPLIDDLVPVIVEQTHERIAAAASRFVTSPQFQDLWVGVNSEAHQRVVGLLTGQPVGVASIDENGAVTISTGEIIAQVKERLLEDGVAVAARIPEIDSEITLFQSPDLVRAGQALGLLDRGALILAGLAAIAAAGALVVAPRGSRLRAVGTLGVGVAAAMALLALALALGRAYSLNAIPPDRVDPAAAESLVDTLLAPLQTGLRFTFVAALAVILVAFVAGQSTVAQELRRGVGRIGGGASGRADTGNIRPWRRWLAGSRRMMQAVVVGLTMVVLVLWQEPTAASAVWTVAVAGVVVVVIGLLSRAVPGALSENGRAGGT